MAATTLQPPCGEGNLLWSTTCKACAAPAAQLHPSYRLGLESGGPIIQEDVLLLFTPLNLTYSGKFQEVCVDRAMTPENGDDHSSSSMNVCSPVVGSPETLITCTVPGSSLLIATTLRVASLSASTSAHVMLPSTGSCTDAVRHSDFPDRPSDLQRTC